jgi:hypothetical protein
VFVPSLTGLGNLSFPFPGTPVPGYRLLRPFGTRFINLILLHLFTKPGGLVVGGQSLRGCVRSVQSHHWNEELHANRQKSQIVISSSVLNI